MNRLAREHSPYLLQHAKNPVDWYPWGEEAFAKAKREDKPIFLSIGYSTCYWCHVMEAESFENPAIGKLMNDTVVAIKVDREERPDLDAVYMSAVQAMSGQGGWPMSVFLTPEGKPFWGGTYFPPEDRGGRPGFTTILNRIRDVWNSQREQVLESSQAITVAINETATGRRSSSGGPENPLTIETLNRAASQFAQQFDERFGGFGDAPKFPRPHSLSCLLRAWSRDQDAKTLRMVEETLQRMAAGGIHDQVGGGFHRYSTDAHWLVPHFEKMLYDQALMARAYLEGFQATENPLYADVARDIFEYVLRDMRDVQGAFYAAEDAGEVGEEGAFYVWTLPEIERILTPDETKVVKRVYGITPEGNFSESGTPGATILSIVAPESASAALESARKKLLPVRSQRPRPHRDDKVLTDWNGLMIGALAYGARALQEPRYAEAAAQAADFLLTNLQRDGHLLHRYRQGQADIPAFLEDYSFLSWGLLDLYEATFDARWLAEAQRVSRQMVDLFWDQQGGGFFLSGSRNEPLIAKRKELYDGALPSGNSVAALVLVRLGQLTQDRSLEPLVERMMQTFSNEASQLPSAFPQFMVAVDWWLGPSQEIVIAGDPAAADTKELLEVIRRRFLPRAALILHPSGGRGKDIERLVPFLKQQPAATGATAAGRRRSGGARLEGRATAYVCQRGACQLPTSDPAQLATLLDRQ